MIQKDKKEKGRHMPGTAKYRLVPKYASHK